MAKMLWSGAIFFVLRCAIANAHAASANDTFWFDTTGSSIPLLNPSISKGGSTAVAIKPCGLKGSVTASLGGATSPGIGMRPGKVVGPRPIVHA